eukprot:6432789-Pyramimonas_sp.AAC.2
MDCETEERRALGHKSAHGAQGGRHLRVAANTADLSTASTALLRSSATRLRAGRVARQPSPNGVNDGLAPQLGADAKVGGAEHLDQIFFRPRCGRSSCRLPLVGGTLRA